MEIQLNGKPFTANNNITLFQLAEQVCPGADVHILNGYQTAQDLPLSQGDTVNLIIKGKMPDAEVLESMMAARHTPQVHSKVKQARVAIAGLGGLGSNIALMLARTGVGELFLVDFDVVEPSNLNRQCYSIRHLGMEKTIAMAEQIKQINPYISVKTQTCRITAENAAYLFAEYPLMCEAFDNPAAKAMLVNTLLEQCPDTVIVSASGMAGYGSANRIRTEKRFSRLYVCGDGDSEAMPGYGLMAPRVTVCAAHQANLVLRLILGLNE